MSVPTNPFYRYLKVLFTLILVVIAGCGISPEEKKAAHYQKGMAYINSGEYRAAVIEFRNAVQIDPAFADARYQLGLAYLKTDQPGNALEELERAASLNPSNIDARIKVAEIYLAAQNTGESIKALEELISSNPGFSDAHALLARARLVEGRTAPALEAINRALALDPEKDSYYIIRGQALAAAERFDEAEDALKKAVEIEPSLRNIRTLISFYSLRGPNDAAESVIAAIIEQQPHLSGLQLDLATFYTHRGMPDKAEHYILSAIDQNPRSPEIRIYLGNFYLRFREPEKAEKAFKEAVDVSENPVHEKTILADFYFNTRRYDLAASLVDAVLKSNPLHAPANLVKAKLLVRDQKNSQALAILDRLVNEYPRWGDVYYQKGVAHLNRGEIHLSYSAAESALQYSPNSSEAMTLMAQHRMMQGQYNEAKASALSALQVMPGNIRAGIILGRSMINLNETDGAIRLFENMVQQEPGNTELQFNQAEAYIAGNRAEDALAAFRKILATNPDFVPAMSAVSTLQVQQGNARGAISEVREQLQKSPDNAHYMVLLAGLIHTHGPSPDEALALLATARETSPDIPRIYSMTANILMQQGRLDEAIESYQAMIEKHPDMLEGHIALGTLKDQAGNTTGAMKAYSKALEIQPGFAPAANNLAWLIAKSEKPDLGEALRLALIAKAALPEDPMVSDTLGYIHYRRGSYQLAMTQFNQAIEKRPDMAVLHYHMALALHADGHTQKAIDALEKALSLEADFPEHEKADRLLTEIKHKPDSASGN